MTPEQAPPNTGRPFLRRGPSGPLANATGLIQCGYDQPIKSQLLPTSSFNHAVPRDAALNPLQVQLPNVTPGNVLEVDFSGMFGNQGNASSDLAFIVAVSFDGSTSYPTNFFGVNNSQSGDFVAPAGAGHARCFAAITIPDGATTATVQVIYNDFATGGFFIFGTDTALSSQTPSVTLKASEIAAVSVPQPGPSTLIPAV